MQKFNIALVFEQEVSSQIIEYAEQLYKDVPSQFSLGRSSIPHMTIIQFTAEESVKNLLWKECNKLRINTPNLILSGLTVLPSSSGGAWIEISVLKSNELLNMQHSVASLLPTSIKPDNDVGDKYRPHITVAHLTESRATVNIPLKYSPLRLSDIESKLALGVGINFDPCLEIL